MSFGEELLLSARMFTTGAGTIEIINVSAQPKAPQSISPSQYMSDKEKEREAVKREMAEKDKRKENIGAVIVAIIIIGAFIALITGNF